MIQALAFLTGLFKKENLKLLIFAAIAVFLFIFFQTCNNNQKLKEQIKAEKLEQQRIKNNWDASRDTLRQYVDKNGTLEGEISGYRLTQKELVTEYKDLFSSVEKFKKEWEKTPPKTIVETHYTTLETIKDFQVSTTQNGQSGTVKFSADTIFNKGNSRSIKGTFKYGLDYFNKSDSSLLPFVNSPLYAKVNPFSPELTIEQKMNLNTGINQDKQTGKLKIWVTTDYPGVTFTDIKGAEIFDSKETAKLLGKPRRSWGLGFNFGPSLQYNPSTKQISPGVSVGIGINFTPKKLQF